VRRPCLQIRPNGFPNKAHVAQLVIPESPSLDVSRTQIRVAFLVLALLKRKPVLAAVQFEVVPGLRAVEIEVVFTHFVLPAELVASESPVTENAPQPFLGPRGLHPEGAGNWLSAHRGMA
jgi:hypothetical protein